MTHEKIIRRDDGSRVKIMVRLSAEWSRESYLWDFECYKCDAGKRTFYQPFVDRGYLPRHMTAEQREAERKRNNLTLASEEEVLDVMRELLAKIEPKV